MNIRRQHNNRSLVRQLAGWCGLLLYVIAFSPIGMGAAALLGTIDSDHRAILEPGTDGMRLVLHHEGNCFGHHHGTVARALTVFAQPVSDNDPDHALQFSSANGLTRDSQFIVPSANQSELVIVAFTEPVSPASANLIQFIPATRPSSGSDGKLLCLRTTVLLI